jgi:hypothetical protein
VKISSKYLQTFSTARPMLKAAGDHRWHRSFSLDSRSLYVLISEHPIGSSEAITFSHLIYNPSDFENGPPAEKSFYDSFGWYYVMNTVTTELYAINCFMIEAV